MEQNNMVESPAVTVRLPRSRTEKIVIWCLVAVVLAGNVGEIVGAWSIGVTMAVWVVSLIVLVAVDGIKGRGIFHAR